MTEMLRAPRRRRRVRRVRRRRAGRPGPRRPGDDQQHEPRVRGDRDALPDRRRDARLPPPDRPVGGAGRPRRALREGAGPVARAGRRARTSTRCSSWTSRRSSRRWPARAGRRTACRSRSSATTSGRTSRTGSARSTRPASRPDARRAARSRSRPPESFPASDPPSFAAADARTPADAPATAVRPRGAADDGHYYRPVDDRGRRPAGDDPDGLGGDRRDHLVHEHLEPDRDGRRRAAGPERGRPRPDRRADGEDVARARLEGRHRATSRRPG